ncbi:MAG: AAA family ATPase [Chloroflexi bacterium]|nr:AAA family ATPase [Chloroflexota bacterium]
MNALLEAALARAREGACVIPLWSTNASGVCNCPKTADCASPGKHPRTKNGLDDASRDPNTIERWWSQWPDANIGVRTDEVVRIDIDLRDVADALSDDVPLRAETELVRTPRRGGLHIALKVVQPVAGRDLFLGDGRKLGELKAARGYVLVPPSAIGTGEYQLLSVDGIDPLEVDDPVAWLRNVLPAFGYALTDESERPARAYEALSGAVYEGEGRHNALVSYAGKVWVEGMAPETLASVLHVVNDAQCRPPLPGEEVRGIAQHFIEGRERRRDSTQPSPGSEPVVPRYVTSILSLDDWLDGEDPPLDVVLGDAKDGAILPIDGKGFIAGSTGIGKTNLLLRLGRCLAEGTPFLGRFPVPEARVVLHVALEGSRRGLRRRLKKVWHGASTDARSRYFLVFTQLNLSTQEDVAELERLISETHAEVVIIDPLRNAHTWDENDSRDTALLTSTLDGVIARHRCALIAAHHDRKKPPMTKRDSGTDRIRGSTALAGWLSFCLSVEKDKTPDTLIAEWTKVRDAEEGIPELLLAFDRETLDYTATERTAASKVSDDDVLTAVFHAGPEGLRGSVLVEVVRDSTGAGERTVKDRVRELVKERRLIEFIADEDRAKRAKSYRLSEEDQ